MDSSIYTDLSQSVIAKKPDTYLLMFYYATSKKKRYISFNEMSKIKIK